MLYIKNGTVIDPVENRTYRADLQIENEKIFRIISEKEDHAEENVKETDVIDAERLMIAPGLADTHVHFRDPGFLYK